jgi:hypothetical protein
MKRNVYASLVVLVFWSLTIQAQTQLLVGYETDQIPSATQVSLVPDVTQTGLVAGDLLRGPGLTASGTAANTFSAGNFTATDFQGAVAAGSFFEFELEAAPGYFFTPLELTWHFRRSGTGPLHFQWVYSLDQGQSLVPFHQPILYDGTQNNGFAFGPLAFPEAAALQNLVAGSPLKLRLYGWGASSAGGVGAFGRLAGPDLALYGTVTAFGSPTAILRDQTPQVPCIDAVNGASVLVTVDLFNNAQPEPYDFWLSDGQGDFANQMLVGQGTLPSHVPQTTITAQIPAGLPAASGYRLRLLPANGIATTSVPFDVVNGVPSPFGLTILPSNTALELSWSQLPGCWDEALVVVSTQPLTTIPSGTGSQWASQSTFSGNLNFNNEGQVVYQGQGTSVLVSGLQNGQPYYASIFNRQQTTWSSGVVISGTPNPPIEGWQIDAVDVLFEINFDGVVNGVVQGPLAGNGLSPNPTAGQLDTRSWRINGMSDQPVTQFEQVYTTGDFARGASAGGITTGGLWAFQVAPGDMALGVQPIASDFNPGTMTLRVQNKTGVVLEAFQLAYDFYEFNDQDRSSSWQVAHSADDVVYQAIPELNMVSKEAREVPAQWRRSRMVAMVSGIQWQPEALWYLQWQSADVGGSGTRDELALDNIQLVVFDAHSPRDLPVTVSGTFREVRLTTDAFAAVPVGGAALVDEVLSVDGTLLVAAHATGYGNLQYEQAQGSGTIRMQTYLSGGGLGTEGRWFHMGFPGTAAYSHIHDGQSAFNLSNRDQSPLLQWDADLGDWVLPSGGAHGAFVPGTGYLVFAGENATGTYTMSLPGMMSFDLAPTAPAMVHAPLGYTAAPRFANINGAEQAGWNLVANPYTTTYDLHQQAVPQGMAGFGVRRNETNTGFETYVFTESFAVGRYIAPFQAFWVRTVQNQPDPLVFVPSRRTGHAWPQRTKTEEAVQPLILEVRNQNGHRDETRIYFREEATEAFDLMYDGDKLPNDDGFPSLFTHSIEGQPLAVNSLPIHTGIRKIPLSFSCNAAGHYVFNTIQTDVFGPVFIKDLKTGHLHELSDRPFGFLHHPNDVPERFEIILGARSRDMIPDTDFVVWFQHGDLNIRAIKPITEVRLRLQDVAGRRVADVALPFTAKQAQLPMPHASGVYVLTFIRPDGTSEVHKVVKP